MSKTEELAEAIKGIEAEIEALRAENLILRQDNHELLDRVNVLIKIMEGAQ